MSELVVTLGIDLSADVDGTAACTIRWEDGKAFVEVPRRRLGNAELRELIAAADWSGIDAPFSWPVPFRDALTEHAAGGGWDEDYRSPRFQYRATDLFVTGIARRPLSVSTDRIGVTAMRCARLLEEVGRDRGKRLDPTGRDQVVEVYPAAALSAWGAKEAGFDPQGYKVGPQANEKRRKLVEAFIRETAGWLDFPEGAQRECIASHDPLDAFIAALATRAAQLGRTREPETDEQSLAPIEGWIHVPKAGSLAELPFRDESVSA
jgi:predicted nuclease with RNAse H fold